MKRLLSIIAATAAAAAVAAAFTLPAGADDGPTDELATFTSCLRVHGLAVPEGLDAMATKTWVGAHQDSPGFEAAINACDPKPDRPAKNSAPEELVACLRAHGLNPPSSIDELKPYMLQQDGTTAGRAALSACGIDSRPVEKARGKGDCGGDRPPAKASRAKAVPEQ